MNHARLVVGFIALGVLGCSRTQTTPQRPASITLATTTSTQDSGLLDVLIPLFRKETGIDVKVVAVGSGQAHELGRHGDADVLLVHSPAAEEAFVGDGLSLERVPVMVNDFVLVGPANDPGQIRGRTSVTDAFHEVARRRVLFVSRADDSGTHQKEQAVWKASHVQPEGDWYLRAGTGMAQALRLANEKRSYILSDRATYLALRDTLDLIVISEGDPLLKNPYHVLIVNPGKHPKVNLMGARQFVEFLTSRSTQNMISKFGIDKYWGANVLPARRHPIHHKGAIDRAGFVPFHHLVSDPYRPVHSMTRPPWVSVLEDTSGYRIPPRYNIMEARREKFSEGKNP
jgi:tungstate transport system substrate-binding protein